MMGEVGNIQHTEEAFTPPIHGGLTLQHAEPVHCGIMAIVVLERFRNDEELMALPVVDDQMQALGLITRRKILSVFGHKFAHELYRRKQADILMESHSLILDKHTGIEQISCSMTNRDECHAFDPAIITCDGIYEGMLSVISVLRSITSSRLERAFDSNPLTHLPGNNSINKAIDERLLDGKSFVLVYSDLDYFKVFNDFYGYERGDRVIQLVATLMKEIAGPADFVGHVGGDDFVMLIDQQQWRPPLDAMLIRFTQQSLDLYGDMERESGFLIGENRQGVRMQFPLMSLSLAVVPCEDGCFRSHIEVAEVASEMKHRAKAIEGNSLVVNQRHY